MSDAPFQIGEKAPAFELADTSGAPHALPEPGSAPATVVVWTCNHCPYALAWHERLQAVARVCEDQGIPFLQINSNDPQVKPGDSLEAMRERVENGEFAGPYLHDPEQTAARDYGAVTTPDVFVLDSELRLAYRGAPDADYEDPAQDAAWLRAALDDVVSGRKLDMPETKPVGCSIKWKP